MLMNQMIRFMKQISGRVGSNIYASVQDPSNPQHIHFLRQLQKEMKKENSLNIPLQELPVVVFDLETSGFFPQHGDQILSIGAVKVLGPDIQNEETFYSLVDSGVTPSPEIIHLTGITAEDLRSAPPPSVVLQQFFQFMNGSTLVAHHAKHERDFMQHITWNLLRASFDHRIVDTSFLIQIVEPNVKLASLEECCSHYGIEVEGRHHALEDAKMTAQLWTKNLNQIQAMGYETLNDVYEQLARIRL